MRSDSDVVYTEIEAIDVLYNIVVDKTLILDCLKDQLFVVDDSDHRYQHRRHI